MKLTTSVMSSGQSSRQLMTATNAVVELSLRIVATFKDGDASWQNRNSFSE